MRHGREHAKHRQLAHVALAEISLQPPDRNQNLRRHSEPLLDPRPQRGMTLHHCPPAIDPPRADAGGDILLEALLERLVLAPSDTKRRGILGDTAERRA